MMFKIRCEKIEIVITKFIEIRKVLLIFFCFLKKIKLKFTCV